MPNTKIARSLLFVLVAATAGCAARPQLPSAESQHAMSLFAAGKSIDQITTELRLDSPEAARTLVHDGMIALQQRWFANRYSSR